MHQLRTLRATLAYFIFVRKQVVYSNFCFEGEAESYFCGRGGLTLGAPSQPIMSDGSSPPAMGGEGRGHNGHTRVEKWAAGRMECRINDICITPNTTVMYDVKNTNTPKKTFCCNGDLITFSRRFMAQCQKYKPDYQFETLCYWLLTCHALHLCHQ